MATAIRRRSFTIDEYERMVTAGILHEDERVELLEGEIVCMAPIGIPHAACIKRLILLLTERLARRALVDVQDPVWLPPRSEPQPDVAVLRWRDDFYASAHPGPSDVLLLIEVADTSLAYDRDIKLPLYAAAGIPEVWIVDLDGERILVYRRPDAGRYTEILTVERGGTLAPAAFPDLILTLDEVLGPAA